MKKTIFVLVLSLFFLTGCFEKKILIDKGTEDIIGMWTLSNYTPSDGDSATVEEATFQFNEDGSCSFKLKIKALDSSVAWNEVGDGTCYLNGSKSKFIMNTNSEFFSKWEKYEHNGDSLTIGNYEFTKVS